MTFSGFFYIFPLVMKIFTLNRLFVALFLFSALLIFSACEKNEDLYIKTELYFGLSQNNKTISESEWNSFEKNEISIRLPEGYTIYDADGAWKDKNTGLTLKEKSKVLVVIHHEDQRKSQAIDQIRARYMKQFYQQSVMRIDHKVKMKPLKSDNS